jgi:hypothetical protein
MVLGSYFCLLGDQWLCSAWSWVRIYLTFSGVNGGVVHGRGSQSEFLGSMMV